jgi:long-chain acyl-CoA synthetase
VLRDGANANANASAQEIIDYCRTPMARYPVPMQVQLPPKLPRSLVSKVRHHQLLQEEEIEERTARAPAEAAGDAIARAS